MPAVQAKIMLENIQNAFEDRKFVDVPASKNKRFLARKIHKLKKILKLTSRFFSKHESATSDISLEEWQNHQNSIEEQMQNYENELLEKKLSAKHNAPVESFEHDQNIANENWENWDSCYLCAQSQYSMSSVPSRSPSPASVCYVYMPGQIEPVPVRLRNARIPGGVMWIVYRPDLDICHRDNLYQITSNQIAQAQRPIFV